MELQKWAHRLPDARVVDRSEFLCSFVSGKRVIHLGFCDSGCRELRERLGSWLHEHLAASAQAIVGIDLDTNGVSQARRVGYEAYVADCRDPEAIRTLGIAPADVVIAGEVVEHLDAPGPFLDGLHGLVRESGSLVITTPNAYSLRNPLAALRRYESIHPDHVALYSWFTLTNLLQRHAWRVDEFLTYLLPSEGEGKPDSSRQLLESLIAKGLWGTQRSLARWRAPFVADGLIAVCKET